jgi:hypothetical protein
LCFFTCNLYRYSEALPLVCAQERLLLLDMQMEALLHERAEVVCDLHANNAQDGYQMIHHMVMVGLYKLNSVDP